jgi:hypothetical protein
VNGSLKTDGGIPRSKPGISDGAPGGFFVGVTGFVGQHSRFGPVASFSFLPADFFDAGLLRSHCSGLQLFNFVEQDPSRDESVEALLTHCLALDLQAGWPVEQHDAGGRFIDILPPMPS